MNQDELQRILDRGDAEACVRFFHGASENERSALAKQAAAWYSALQKRSRGQADEAERRQVEKQLAAARVAVLAACSLTDLKRLGWLARPTEEEFAKVLGDRRPKWIADYAAAILDEDRYWAHWGYVRRLVREGICPRPDHPHYIVGMVGGLARSRGDIEIALLQDPELLEREVWELFDHEGGGENSLANHDRWGGHPWTTAFCKLSASGRLDRGRLLDRSLDALERDFNQYQARWHAGLHDALQPTRQEKLARMERYLHLLTCNTSVTTAWAFKIVEDLDKEEPVESNRLADGLGAVMRSRHKGIVKNALKLLDRVVKRDPAISSRAALVAAEALAHEDPDAQLAALKAIGKYGDRNEPDLLKAVQALVEVVAPSVRAQMADWMVAHEEDTAVGDKRGEGQPAVDFKEIERRVSQVNVEHAALAGLPRVVEALKDGSGTILAATFDGTEFRRLDPQQQLAPIQDLDELFDVCARVIEEPILVDEAERAFDAMSRLCDQRPPGFDRRIGPVLKRAVQTVKRHLLPFTGFGPGADICGVVIALGRKEILQPRLRKLQFNTVLSLELDGDEYSTLPDWREQMLGFLGRRSLALAERVLAGSALPLLSSPTHRGGWLDPRVFVSRANQWIKTCQQPDLHDLCLALLRLAPEHRQAALDELAKDAGEWAQATRYSLGAKRITIGPTAALWACAARSRSPWSDDDAVEQKHPGLGPDAGHAARYAVKSKKEDRWERAWIESDPPVPRKADRNLLPVLMHVRPGASANWFQIPPLGGSSAASVRWAATVWPLALEAYFAAGMVELAKNLDWHEAVWQNSHYLQPLLDPDVPFRPMALMLLAVGLAAREPGEHGLAADSAIAAIDDGRLDGERLGRAMAELSVTGVIKSARWSKTLSDVARVSPLHSLVVRQAIETSLRGDPSRLARDLHALLDLLRELCIGAKEAIRQPECRKFLAKITGSGKAAKAARTLLALNRDSNTADEGNRHAAARSLEGRLARVTSWGRRNGS